MVLKFSRFIQFVWMLSVSPVFAGEMGSLNYSQGKLYGGIFGGRGAVSSVRLKQFGTSYQPAEKGGPLAVNAFGDSESTSAWVLGGHVGYAWPGITLTQSQYTLVPAVELEGYYLNNTLVGNDLNNGTTRFIEHDFRVTYPINTGVFLINGVLNLRNSTWSKIHPYVGVGIGSAVISIES